MSGWWLTYPSEKYESQWGWDDNPYMTWKKNVPNHQPVISWNSFDGSFDGNLDPTIYLNNNQGKWNTCMK